MDTWLVTQAGAEDSAYVRAVSRLKRQRNASSSWDEGTPSPAAGFDPSYRSDTIRFFYENKMMRMGDEGAFREVFPAIAGIASRAGDHLQANDRSPMNTSATKLIDNAIIGYVWSKQIQPDDEA